MLMIMNIFLRKNKISLFMQTDAYVENLICLFGSNVLAAFVSPKKATDKNSSFSPGKLNLFTVCTASRMFPSIRRFFDCSFKSLYISRSSSGVIRAGISICIIICVTFRYVLLSAFSYCYTASSSLCNPPHHRTGASEYCFWN